MHHKEIGGALYRQEARTGHVDGEGLLEAGNTSSSGGLQLENTNTTGNLRVGDDVDLVKSSRGKDLLKRFEVNPQVVGVENLELLDGSEVRNLRFISTCLIS